MLLNAILALHARSPRCRWACIAPRRVAAAEKAALASPTTLELKGLLVSGTGMFGVSGTPDVSGYGRLVRPAVEPENTPVPMAATSTTWSTGWPRCSKVSTRRSSASSCIAIS